MYVSFNACMDSLLCFEALNSFLCKLAVWVRHTTRHNIHIFSTTPKIAHIFDPQKSFACGTYSENVTTEGSKQALLDVFRP